MIPLSTLPCFSHAQLGTPAKEPPMAVEMAGAALNPDVSSVTCLAAAQAIENRARVRSAAAEKTSGCCCSSRHDRIGNVSVTYFIGLAGCRQGPDFLFMKKIIATSTNPASLASLTNGDVDWLERPTPRTHASGDKEPSRDRSTVVMGQGTWDVGKKLGELCLAEPPTVNFSPEHSLTMR